MAKQYEELSIAILIMETEDIVTASGDWADGQWSDGNGDHGKDWYW